MNLDGKGKVALVTGGSRGIGQAIVTLFLENNYKVITTATSSSGVEKLNTMLADRGKAYQLDLSDPNSIESLTKQLTQDDNIPEILINNAGITNDNLLLRMTNEQWHSVLNVNLTGTMLLSKAFLKPMMKKRFGRIINISSVVALTGNPGQANYCAAKAGVIGFSKSLAKEVASRNITVNVIAPGFIETDMTGELDQKQSDIILQQIPMQKMGNPEDLAGAALFLGSDLAGYITGTTINVNGGMLMV